MCGIAGIAGRRNQALVKRMTDAVAHRGPDDEGFYVSDAVTLGHRRLSIIDLAGGHQPMSDESETLWVVFNGEIYNFRELRRILEAKGYRFRTNGDTEVILHAYAEYGEDCVAQFRGMFAFALWDAREHSLFLARDPIGVKPLYYALRGHTLYFASEIKALLACPEIPRDMDYESLDDFLAYLYTVPPRTMFRAIRQLPPAHVATWKSGHWTERRYWRLEFAEEKRSEGEWTEAVNACLAETIDQHMIADVPLGAFLSGGLDSATIVYNMAQAATQPVNTFTVGFGSEGGLYDETAYARAIAGTFRTRHHELTAKADVLTLLPTMVRHFDEPFGNPSALLFYILSKVIREHVTVVLSGDGGDESFGGYPRHAGARLSQRYRRLPLSLRKYLINPLVQRLPESTRGFHALRRLREFSAGSMLEPIEMYAAWISYFSPVERRNLYAPEVRRHLYERDALDYVRSLFRECQGIDLVSQTLYVDLMSFLPHNLLQCSDRMSMAHALEARVPFADQRLIELVAKIPSHLKVRGLETKYLLRRCMRDRLPKNTVRRKKLGFNPPLGVWMNTRLKPLLEDFLSEGQIKDRGYFDPRPIQAMIRDHRASRRDYTWHLWALLLFEQWHRIYLDTTPAA